LIVLSILLAAPLALKAQTTYSPSQSEAQSALGAPSDRVLPVEIIPRKVVPPPRPLSRVAVGVGISPLGPELNVATNLNRHFNFRGTGHFFTYQTDFTTSGITSTASINLASGGATLDVYPFRSGFRISPGALFYDQNRLTANAVVPGGSSITLNSVTYYSATANPITGAVPLYGTGTLGLHTTRPAFTVSTGWGNMIPASGRHWSFPFELGVAFTGAPTLKVNVGGWVCEDQAQTMCYDFANDPNAAGARADMQAQIAKWESDLNPLKIYPVVSFGVAYNFKIRADRAR
jgi:hypothetical protein